MCGEGGRRGSVAVGRRVRYDRYTVNRRRKARALTAERARDYIVCNYYYVVVVYRVVVDVLTVWLCGNPLYVLNSGALTHSSLCVLSC